MKNVKIVGQIYETTNYDMFKFNQSNREINKGNLTKVKKSIAKAGLMTPIEVDRITHEVLDGQHRLEACQQLGVPVKFFWSFANNVDASILENNTTGKKWSLDQIVEKFAKTKGKHQSDYQELWSLHQECRSTINSLSIIVSIIGNGPNAYGGNVTDKVKSVDFQITNYDGVNFIKRLNLWALGHGYCQSKAHHAVASKKLRNNTLLGIYQLSRTANFDWDVLSKINFNKQEIRDKTGRALKKPDGGLMMLATEYNKHTRTKKIAIAVDQNGYVTVA